MDAYKKVTERIIDMLKAGTIPWEQPWIGGSEAAFNRITRRRYSLLNQFLLGECGEYASIRQWNSLGGKVRKGEKAHPCVFWKLQTVKDKKADETEDESDGSLQVPILRQYSVFHISQVTGVKPLKKEEYPDVAVPDADTDALIDGYVRREGVQIVETENGSDAYYSPVEDKITIPQKKQFRSTSGFYETLFHELTHSTGSPKRLNRIIEPVRFGSEPYSKEELVAEIGSATLMNILHLETEKTIRNNVAYIANWIQVLKNDERFIVSASSKADRAVRMILGTDETMEQPRLSGQKLYRIGNEEKSCNNQRPRHKPI